MVGGRVRGVSAVHCGARPCSPRPAVGFKDRRDLNRGQWETGNLGDLWGSLRVAAGGSPGWTVKAKLKRGLGRFLGKTGGADRKLQFSVSFALTSLTLSWLLGQERGGVSTRVEWWLC